MKKLVLIMQIFVSIAIYNYFFNFFLDFTSIGAVKNCIATPCWIHSDNNVFIFFQPCSVDVATTIAVFFYKKNLNSLLWFLVFLIMVFFCVCLVS